MCLFQTARGVNQWPTDSIVDCVVTAIARGKTFRDMKNADW